LRRLALPLVLPYVLPFGLLALTGCSEGYSPNTYASSAAQQEAAVQRGVIVGVRQVMISANGTIGTAAGGAAGGVAGSQVAGGPVVTALGAIGGTLVGGIGGAAATAAVADTKGWEYIVQEDGNKLVSVTQTSKTALAIGQHVLVISDSQQARIVPDYTVQTAAAAANGAAKPAAAGSGPEEVNLSPLPADTSAAPPLQVAPIAVANDPESLAAPAAASAAAATPESAATSTVNTVAAAPAAATAQAAASTKAPATAETGAPAQSAPAQNTPAQSAPAAQAAAAPASAAVAASPTSAAVAASPTSAAVAATPASGAATATP
jgi:outer membrane lipoprotein SlyB